MLVSIAEYIIFHGAISQVIFDCQNIINLIDGRKSGIMFAKYNTLHNSIISSNKLQEKQKYLKNIYIDNEIPNFDNSLLYYQFLGTQVNCPIKN